MVRSGDSKQTLRTLGTRALLRQPLPLLRISNTGAVHTGPRRAHGPRSTGPACRPAWPGHPRQGRFCTGETDPPGPAGTLAATGLDLSIGSTREVSSSSILWPGQAEPGRAARRDPARPPANGTSRQVPGCEAAATSS